MKNWHNLCNKLAVFLFLPWGTATQLGLMRRWLFQVDVVAVETRDTSLEDGLGHGA